MRFQIWAIDTTIVVGLFGFDSFFSSLSCDFFLSSFYMHDTPFEPIRFDSASVKSYKPAAKKLCLHLLDL